MNKIGQITLEFDPYMGSAVMSPDGKYRHILVRVWDKEKPPIMFLMLNPSKADAYDDDPTIRRCIGFARSWGYGGIYVGNLFDFRSTDPSELLRTDKPFSKWNTSYIRDAAHLCDKVICAWGNAGIVKKITKKHTGYSLPAELREKLYYLELMKDGVTPKHPLYLKGDLKPIKLDEEEG